MSIHFSSLMVKEVRRETPDCVSVAFDIPPDLEKTFRFMQGQNITVKVSLGGEEIRRSYSICSAPHEKELRIAVKRVEQGIFSGYANQELRAGNRLDVLPPTGKFFTPLAHSQKKRYLAFAAGSGITPVISLIKATLHTEPGSEFTLVYGNRNRHSIIFFEELEGIKNKYISRFNLIHVLSREKTDSPVNSGRLGSEKCSELAEKLIDIESMDEIFICGPEEMIFSVKDWLEKRGVSTKKIHFELFTVPGESKKIITRQKTESLSRTTKSLITIRQDGIAFDFELEYNGDSILEAGLKQGVDLPFSCKGGVCSTCRARLIEGEVEMEANWALEPGELKEGFILTCQSHPKTDRVVVDYDLR